MARAPQMLAAPAYPAAGAFGASDAGLPPGYDAGATHDVQVGQIFTNMRLAMKVSRDTIARRLATTVFTVEAFETGALASLPHWRETARIVRGYCELLRLDPEPILWRLRSHYHASGLPMGLMAAPARASQEAEASEWADPPPISQRRRPAENEGASPRRRRRRRSLLVVTAPVFAVVGLLLGAQTAPGSIYSALAWLPHQVGAPARVGVDLLVQTMAPTREGLRWVDIGDPQLRKSDKLHTSRR